MVLESVAEILLSRFLDKIFFGITKKNIEVGFLEGRFVLSNIGLQPSLLMNLNLPVDLKYSYVERVEINLPWREEEVYINISISNIYVLLAARPNTSEAELAKMFTKKKEDVVGQALKEFKTALEEQKQSKKEYGYIEKILLNLLDNVSISIQCIHLRYENPLKNYAFGVKVNEVKAQTVDAHDQPHFFNRQRSPEEYVRYLLEMDFMGIYFNSREELFLARKSPEEITDAFNRLSHRRVRSYSDHCESEEGGEGFHYVLTISLKTWIRKYIKALEGLSQKQKEKEKEKEREGHRTAVSLGEKEKEKYLFECEINLNRIESKVTGQQYYDLLDVANSFSEYQRSYQYLLSKWQLSNHRQKKAREVMDLLRKKKAMSTGPKEQQMIKRTCSRYLGWIFRHTFQEALKRRFIREATKKEITLKNLQSNPKLLAIMRKIENEKLKQWLLIALHCRRRYEDTVGVLFRSTTRHAAFMETHLDSLPFFTACEFEEEVLKGKGSGQGQFGVFLKLKVNIREVGFEIAQQQSLGVSFKMKKLKWQLTLREKNYLMRLSMEDLEADVFNCRQYQKLKTYVPILKRNCVLDPSIDLLEISYERNPRGKPFVFTELNVLFESIEITIYPEAFKQFYQILLGESNTPKKPTKKGKRKQSAPETNDSTAIRRVGFQKTIIRGKIRSPWIVLPLSTNNDLGKQCWVVRLGDLGIDTPQGEGARTQQQLFYEQYKLQLKRFELNYFSSIHYFHNWQKFNQSLDSLSKMRVFDKQKVITMIEPFSCFVDFSALKSHLSPAIRDRKYKFIARINIEAVNIRISKFLLAKLKYRLDIFGDPVEELADFIERDVGNIREEHEMSGYCRVSYEGMRKLQFYCVLKGDFVYFFLSEHHNRYHFFLNLNHCAIRLVSNEVENINPHLSPLLALYLPDRNAHLLWRKKITHLLNRKDRRIDATLRSTIRPADSTLDPTPNQPQLPRSDSRHQDDQPTQSGGLKLSLGFHMQRLAISLIDQKDELFLQCEFRKAALVYQVLQQKQLRFSLNEWTVKQSAETMFASSRSFFDEQQSTSTNLNNFLEIRCKYNDITGELSTILVEVDKIFLAWKVELITKTLLFFFYEEQVGDTPAPLNLNKRQLHIVINVQKFNFYCYFAEELIALGKLQHMCIRYSQNSQEEIYDVTCKIFEMDKYDRQQQRTPMIQRSLAPDSPELTYNNFNLYYILRKKDTEAFPNITQLKQKLGEDLLVSQITCDWKDTLIYFENELTFRLLNYILNKFLGTVASKFKKREYSPNYIFEYLKLRKISVFDIKLTRVTFRMPPHLRGFREFVLEMDLLHVTKNIDPRQLASEVEVATIREPAKFFKEAMVFKIVRARLNYQVGRETATSVSRESFDIELIYSKVSFQKEYFVILHSPDDVDRTATMDVVLEQPLSLELHKVMFVTFLQLFYQNIKHKDGKAEKFEPPLPFPTLREYNIYLHRLGLGLYRFDEKKQKMTPFVRFQLAAAKIKYNQIGTKSSIVISGEGLSAEGDLGACSLDSLRNKLRVEMQSQQGEMKVVINAEHYALQVNLDNLNNLTDFINYDNDFVANQIMPKKTSSWQYVNVFAKHCQVRLGLLCVQGEFYICYLKGMKNDVENQAQKYLMTEEELDAIRANPSAFSWDGLTDKEIKVNGEDLTVRIGDSRIGSLNSLFFHRYDLTRKLNNRRFKRQRVQVGEGSLHLRLGELKIIWQVYNAHIRKSSSFVAHTFYEPWDQLPPKDKAIEKRSTEVELARLQINILPTLDLQAVSYARIDLELPQILYRTYLDEQEVAVTIRCSVFQSGAKLKPSQILDCRQLKLRYTNFKDRKQKWIEILSGKNIAIYAHLLNDYMMAHILQQVKILSTSSLPELPSHQISFRNQTARRVRLKLANLCEFSLQPHQEETKEVRIEDMLAYINSPTAGIELQEEGTSIQRRNHSEIYVNRTTPINNCLLGYIPNLSKTTFTYRPPYLLANSSSISVICPDRQLLKPQQTSSITLLRPNFMDIEFKGRDWSKRSEIDVRKSHQLIGEDCFVAVCTKQEGGTVTTIKDRFLIKNYLPMPISIRGRQILSLQQIAIGYIDVQSRKALQLSIEGATINIDLTDDSQKLILQRVYLRRQGDSERIPTDIHLETTENDLFKIFTVYSNVSIKNESEKPIVFNWKDKKYLILGNQTSLVPSNLSKIDFLDGQDEVTVQLTAKTKHFFSKSLRFTVTSKLDNRCTTIKIQAKYQIVNNSKQEVEVENRQKKYLAVSSGESRQIYENFIQNDTVTLLFGKYHRKKLDLTSKGSQILQMQQLFFKITVVGRQESVLILVQDSPSGHLITNKLTDVTITAHSYCGSNPLEPISIFQIDNDDNIQKLIRPGEQQHIGTFSWDPKLQLEFYYDSKNIEFKQKFSIDFTQQNQKFSHKHILHDEKDRKVIFILVITTEKDTQGRFTITVYKEKEYENLPIEKMRVAVQEISVALHFSIEPSDAITLQCYRASLMREKGIELQDLDLQIEKLLVREGRNVSIINALHEGKFLNCNLILAKTLRGLGISSLMLKLTPFEIICREKIIFLVLQKIVAVRAQGIKRKPTRSELGESGLSQVSVKLEKEWQSEITKIGKGKKMLTISNLEISQTSIFITYTKEEYRQIDEKILNDRIIKYMLLIPPISELKIAIPHLKINDFQGEAKQFAKELLKHLKQSIGSTIANSFSSLPLFDSPIIAADGIFKYIDGMLSIQ